MAVGAYFLVARTIAVACCKVLGLLTDHYFDGFFGILKPLDRLAVPDLVEFVLQILKVHF